MKTFRLALIISSLFLSNSAKACFCGSEFFGAAGSGSSNNTISGSTLSRGKGVLGFRMIYQNIHEFSDYELWKINKEKKHTHSMDSSLDMYFNLAYGISDDLDLLLALPIKTSTGRYSTYHGMTVDEGNIAGFGDLTLLGKYRIYKSLKHDFHSSVLAGIQLPTGDKSETDEYGFLLAPDDQPSSGSWDPIMGIALSKGFGNTRLDLSSIYRLSTPGTAKVIVGDTVNFNLALSHHLKKSNWLHKFLPDDVFGEKLDWRFAIELNGLWQEQVEYQGIKYEGHGGLTLFLSPGFNLTYSDRVSSFFSMGFPLIQELNGIQPDIGIQIQTGINFFI